MLQLSVNKTENGFDVWWLKIVSRFSALSAALTHSDICNRRKKEERQGCPNQDAASVQ